MTYDHNNIFARLLRHEIPCRLVEESKHTLAFYDLYPKAPLHILIIPKGSYIHAGDFFSHGTNEEILDFSRFIGSLPSLLGLEKNGYRLIANQGIHASQEVNHFHVHLLAGHLLPPIEGGL